MPSGDGRIRRYLGEFFSTRDDTLNAWNVDRLVLYSALQQGAVHETDVRLRNSCEWILAGKAQLFAVIPTHDSPARAAALEPGNVTPRSVAWFAEPRSGSHADVMGPVQLTYADDPADGTGIEVEHHVGLDARGWSTPGVVAITHATIGLGRDAIWQTLKHEVQHDADRHREAEEIADSEAMQGEWDARAGVDGPPRDPSQAEADARAAMRSALVTYKSEYRAFFYMGRFDHLAHDIEHPVRDDGGLLWTHRQKAIFEFIRGAYRSVDAAWKPKPGVDLQVTVDCFWIPVNRYRDPDTEGVNRFNSVRIDALYDAVKQVPLGTMSGEHPAMDAVMAAARALDIVDRAYLLAPDRSRAFHSHIDRHLAGNARLDVRLEIGFAG